MKWFSLRGGSFVIVTLARGVLDRDGTVTRRDTRGSSLTSGSLVSGTPEADTGVERPLRRQSDRVILGDDEVNVLWVRRTAVTPDPADPQGLDPVVDTGTPGRVTCRSLDRHLSTPPPPDYLSKSGFTDRASPGPPLYCPTTASDDPAGAGGRDSL